MRPAIHFQGHRTEPEAFFERWQRSAAALKSLGVLEGDVVALMLRNGPLALELTLAARWVGACWCPVNWHFKAEEVEYILADSGATVFIADDGLLTRLGALQGVKSSVFSANAAGASISGQAVWESTRDKVADTALPQSPQRGAMFYTSGTTGRPKGIRRAPSTPEQVVAGLAVMRHCMGFEQDKYPQIRALVSAPMYHSAPNSYSIGASLQNAELFIEERFDAEDTLRLIDEHRITHAYLVPTMYVRMLRLPDEVKKRYDLSSMKFVGSTGSPCPPDVKRAMVQWWGPVIHESYGSSELGYMTRLDSHEALLKPGSAGKALPGVTIAILDKDKQPLPRGQAGLIYAHHSAVADFTYVGNDAARQKMEVNGLKTMGDIGYLDDDGFLFIVDRSADMVISGGVNIYPAEIEAALQMMPGVADCAVFGVPDDEFGEALMGAVQLAAGVTIGAEEVQTYLKTRLATYKVPKQITFHAELPREDTGKIFKRKLREPYWAGKSRQV